MQVLSQLVTGAEFVVENEARRASPRYAFAALEPIETI
jgi:hypothetical protein